MLKTQVKYSYDDVMIVPSVISSINSRQECNPFHLNGKLPIFAAPMDSVVDEHNYKVFENEHVNVIIPRTVDFSRRQELWHERFVAVSLVEAESIFTIEEKIFPIKICVDVANGHMLSLLRLIEKLKTSFGDKIVVMGGNIANSESYEHYCSVGCDYVRVGIGGGACCLTSNHVGIHYPYASLVDEIRKIKKQNNFKTKIIADGNIKDFGDVNKALALGADYVMIGSLFAKTWESAAETRGDETYFSSFNGSRSIGDPTTVNRDVLNDHTKFTQYTNISKNFYGMSTKVAQKAMGKDVLTTSEGVVRCEPCNCTLHTWVDNCISYLRSVMSYTGSRNLGEFIGNCDLVVISNNTGRRLNK